MRRRLLFLFALAVTCSVGVSVIAGPSSARTSCGTVVTHVGGDDDRYRIYVTRGAVRCSTARATLRAFLKGRSMRGRGWDCRNGLGHVRWSAACGAPLRSLQTKFVERNYDKVIKAYFRR